MDRDEAETGAVILGRKPVLDELRQRPEGVDLVLVRRGAGGKEIGEILDLCRDRRVRFRITEAREVDRLAPGNNQGVAARAASRGFLELEDLLEEAPAAPLPFLAALDQVQDPGNVGALARTLYALGAAGMIVTRHHGALIGPGAVRSSAGAVNRLPMSRVTNMARTLDQSLEAGFRVYGTSALSPGGPAVNLFEAELEFPAVLVLGNEDTGVRPNVAKRCEILLGIPFLRPFDSLNVAQAGGIVAAEFLRRKMAGGAQGPPRDRR